MLTLKELKKLQEERTKYKVYCKCGHSCCIPHKLDYLICSHCHNRVYRTKELEFRYKLKQAQTRTM